MVVAAIAQTGRRNDVFRMDAFRRPFESDPMRIYNPDHVEIRSGLPANRTAACPVPAYILEAAVSAAVAAAGGAHRIFSPVRTPTETLTIRQWYEHQNGARTERDRKIRIGRNKPGTLEKDQSAISFWESHSQNLPLDQVTTDVTAQFVAKALESGARRATITGYVGHLRWMLNFAKVSGLIAETPKWEFPKVSRKRTGTQQEHRQTLIYELDGDLLATLSRIHDAIESRELREAFVCGASFGPRTEDLLTLNWSDFDLDTERPAVRFVAEKTGTFHVVPLADWLAGRLKVWRADSDLLWPDSGKVFPTLIAHKSKQPSKSRAARRTVASLRDAAVAAGFEFTNRSLAERKPFQVLRATCNERFERHHRRAGEWILGHGMAGVNRQSYQNPGQSIYDAVNTLPQPEAFLRS